MEPADRYEEILAEAPIPTFPAKFDIPEIPKVAPEMDLVTDRESSMAADETVKDWPIPTFPVVVRVFKVESPETLKVEVPKLPNIPADVTFKDAPIPTLPEVFKVENWELPVTAREERKLTPELTVSELPIPTFPAKLVAPETPSVAAEMDLVTERESRLVAEETVND